MRKARPAVKRVLERTPVWPSRPPKRRRRWAPDAPSDRLLEQGAGSLGNEDLLNLVLGAAESGVAGEILEHCGGVNRLGQTPLAEIARFRGVSRGRLVRLAAALELGRRAAWSSDGRVPCFRSPREAAEFLISRYGNGDVEEFGVLLLDTRGCLVRCEIISKGSLTGALVHPRDLFRIAVAYQAASVVLFHNHPSGNPSPSDADRRITDRLREVGELVGIPILDHIVLGCGDWYSFGEAGLL